MIWIWLKCFRVYKSCKPNIKETFSVGDGTLAFPKPVVRNSRVKQVQLRGVARGRQLPCICFTIAHHFARTRWYLSISFAFSPFCSIDPPATGILPCTQVTSDTSRCRDRWSYMCLGRYIASGSTFRKPARALVSERAKPWPALFLKRQNFLLVLVLFWSRQ